MGESWVYSLECEDGVIYVGQTEQLFTRLNNHYLSKGAKITKIHRPIRLLGLYKVSDSFHNYKTCIKNLAGDHKKLNESLEYLIFRLFEKHFPNYTVYGASHCRLIDNLIYERQLRPFCSPRPICDCGIPCNWDKENFFWVCCKSDIGWISKYYYNKHEILPENFFPIESCDFKKNYNIPQSDKVKLEAQRQACNIWYLRNINNIFTINILK